VVRELIPHRFVGLAEGDLAEGGAIDPGQHPPVDDEVIDELRERIVPATDGHLLRERGEIGIGELAIIEVAPDPVPRLIESAGKSPSTMNGVGPSAAVSIHSSRTGTCASNVSQAELVELFSKHPLLRCTDRSWSV
jgi:hypothetical protein